MSEYDNVRLGKLVLKGESKKKKQKRKNKNKSNAKMPKILVDDDALKHGGWGKIDKHADISGTVAVEFGSNTYLKALDNGLFTLGAPHPEGEAPAPEEILTVIQISGNKIAFKSGYGKYLKVEKDGMVTGRSDAVGSMEQWEAVFEDGKTALQSELGTFMSIDPEDDTCVALRKMAGEREMLCIRTLLHSKLKEIEDENSEEETDLKQTEIMHVKKFQKFQDKKMRINTGEMHELETARASGTLHEVLLDRRSKMKSDRYSKIPYETQRAQCTINAGDVQASAEASISRTLEGVCGSVEMKIAFTKLEEKLLLELQILKEMMELVLMTKKGEFPKYTAGVVVDSNLETTQSSVSLTTMSKPAFTALNNPNHLTKVRKTELNAEVNNNRLGMNPTIIVRNRKHEQRGRPKIGQHFVIRN